MQKKKHNIKRRFIRFEQDYLHIFPKLANIKSGIITSVRVLIFATAVLSNTLIFLNTSNCFAAISYDSVDGVATDLGTISPITTASVSPATASLSLSNDSMVSNATTTDNTATTSTQVTVSVGNASSYSLTLKMDSTNLTNGSTTLTPGNANTDNTWGYKWDNMANYSAPSTNATAFPNLPSLNSDGAVSFTKTLTFAAKFGTNAEAGHYKTSGVLSLVATPKAATITLENLTQMQQLSLAPTACTNTPYTSGQNYSAEYTLNDVRDNTTYTVRKFVDGKCWMTKNLMIGSTAPGAIYYTGGRKLIPATSDVSSDWTIPNDGYTSTNGFTSDTAINAHMNTNYMLGFYSWCAATAGTCDKATTNGANATASVCPKGWKLPTVQDFENLINLASIADSTEGSTKIQSSPYGFGIYNGYMASNKWNSYVGESHWWSSTASGSGTSSAYNLDIRTNNVSPNATAYRRYGYIIRCIAR